MQIHQIKPIKKPKAKKRIGRGGKKGTYSGKGQKGQKSRAGRKMMPMVREVLKRYPKLKGYKARKSENSFVVLRLDDLQKKFKNSEVVSPKSLIEKKLIRKIKGRVPRVKILKGTKDFKSNFVFEGCEFSKSAKEEIENTGKTQTSQR